MPPSTPIFTLTNLLSDIVEEIMEARIVPGTREKVRETVLAKFISHMETFLSDGCFTDGFRSKKLEGPVYELRIALPSDFLLRVIFAMEKGKIILTTGYLIKEG